MKLIKSFLLLLAMVSLLIVSCAKDDEPVDILQKFKWRIVSWTVNPAVDINGQKHTDLTPLIAACTKDDFIQFKADKTLLSDEGPTKCATTDPQSQSAGKWDLSTDAKSLFLTDTDLSGLTGTVQAIVNKLDASELNITLNKINFGSTVVNITLSLKPI